MKPPENEHVLLPVGDGEVAACVERSDITCVQAAICVDRFGRRLRIIEIAFHHGRTAHPELPCLSHWHVAPFFIDTAHLHAGHWIAAGVGDGLGIIARPRHGDDPALGHAIAIDDIGDAQFATHPFYQRRRDWRRSRRRAA